MAQSTRTETFESGGVPITVERFAAMGASAAERRPAVLLLHGADGLTFADRYRVGAQLTAAAGYHVFLVRYLDRTGEKRASLATIYGNFAPWMETLGDALGWVGSRPGVDAARIGVMGVSLGASLALAVAAQDRRIKALVDYFGPLPDGLQDRAVTLPPTLILHGAADPIVPVTNAYALEALLKQRGIPHEVAIYPAQGHGFYGEAAADAARRVAAFLARHLRAGRASAQD